MGRARRRPELRGVACVRAPALNPLPQVPVPVFGGETGFRKAPKLSANASVTRGGLGLFAAPCRPRPAAGGLGMGVLSREAYLRRFLLRAGGRGT